MAYENVDRVKRNVMAMIDKGAPSEHLDKYLKEEGFTQESFTKALDLVKQSGGKTSEFGAGRSLAQGATFGFADELEALTKSLAGQGTYEQNLAALELAKQKYGQQNPKTALATEIAGGLPYALLPFLGTARYAQMAREASPLVRAGVTSGASAVTGALTGALGGAGAAGVGERMAGAQAGGALGGLVGGAAPAVTKGIGMAGSKVVDVTSGIPVVQQVGKAVGLATGQSVDYANRAKAKLLEALYRDKVSPADLEKMILASANLERTITGTTKPVGIVDIAGENVRSLADVAQKYPSTARQTAKTALEERAAGQGERIQGDISKYLGGFTDPFEYTTAIAQRQQQVSSPLYQKAYAYGEVTDPKVLKFLELPQFKKAAKEAQDLLAAEGRSVDMSMPTVEVLDQVKRGLDVLIKKETDPFGKITDLGRIYKNKKNEFLSELDTAVPDFGRARAAFAGEAELLDATKLGKDFYKQTAAEANRTFAKLSPSEQEAYKVGALDAVKEKITTAKDTADIRKRIFGSPAERDRVSSLFPDTDTFKQFEKDMMTESMMRKTQEKILGNSATFERQIAGQALEAEPSFIGQMIEQGPLRGTMGYLKAQGQGVAGQTAEELGPMLFKLGDPRANLQTLKALSAYEKYLLEQEARKAAGLTGASTMTGLLDTEKPYRIDLTGMANPD
jgi:hypothetical protein